MPSVDIYTSDFSELNISVKFSNSSLGAYGYL